MMGSAAESYAQLREQLDGRRGTPAIDGLAEELFAAADVIQSEPQLRTALADVGQPEASRVALANRIFTDRLSPDATSVIGDAVSRRWSDPQDLVEVLEGLAAQAAFLSAEKDGELDRVESDLFAFQRLVAGSPQLQMALTDPSVRGRGKTDLVQELLAGQSSDPASRVLGHAMGHLRGRRASAVIEDLIDLAAEQRGRGVAEVRVAVPLSPDQHRRLADALSARTGRQVRLNVAVDPAVIGGISVRIGSQVLDATMATRIEGARRAVVGAR